MGEMGWDEMMRLINVPHGGGGGTPLLLSLTTDYLQ